MKGTPLSLIAALALGIAPAALLAADASKPESAALSPAGKGETGPNAECPIEKTIGGKRYCFQNLPALTKRQGGG